jgi:hypothetical protein
MLSSCLLEIEDKIMEKEANQTEAGKKYAEAYAAHYAQRDLPLAFQLYQSVVTSHTSSAEAGYARHQLQNIINDVVPKQELLDAQIRLALDRLDQDGLAKAGRIRSA